MTYSSLIIDVELGRDAEEENDEDDALLARLLRRLAGEVLSAEGVFVEEAEGSGGDPDGEGTEEDEDEDVGPTTVTEGGGGGGGCCAGGEPARNPNNFFIKQLLGSV